jgi:hypothetical protein
MDWKNQVSIEEISEKLRSKRIKRRSEGVIDLGDIFSLHRFESYGVANISVITHKGWKTPTYLEYIRQRLKKSLPAFLKTGASICSGAKKREMKRY